MLYPTHALGDLPFCFSGFPNIVPSENPTGAEEPNFSPHSSSGTMWCWGKVLPLTSTRAQQLRTQAQGTASHGSQPREALQPRSTAPTSIILSPLTQARDRPAVITQGLLIENMVLFWGRPMFPSQPPCLSLHLCLLCLPVCILGSSSPSILSRATSTPGARMGPARVLLSQEGLALAPAVGPLRSPQPHWIPPLAGLPIPGWPQQILPQTTVRKELPFRADLPKPS